MKLAIIILLALGWLAAFAFGYALGRYHLVRLAKRRPLSKWLEFWTWAHQKRRERS